MEKKEMQLLETGLGNVTWWGYSSSFDVLEGIEKSDDINVLLVGAADGRHLFKTISVTETESFNNLSFWILEQNLMTYARQMFFMTLLYDTDLEVTDKAQMYLEIFGNTQLSAKAFQYLTSKSEKLRNIIKHEASKEEGEENQLSSKWIEVDMSLLRYKDLDLLEGIFSLWMSKGREAMDVKKAFDVRVRQLMQSRVENKDGIFDMDYKLRLVDRGGGSISNLEYNQWRNSGNAFEFKQQTDEVGENESEEMEKKKEPNNSLISSLVTHKEGDRLSRRGYWGDIVTGPFIPFGHEYKKEIDIEATKISRTSQDLALSRLETIIKGIEERIKSDSFKRIKLKFLSTNVDRDIREEYDAECETFFVSKHKHLFDRLFIGCSVSHLLSSSLMQCVKPKTAIMYMETPLFLLHMSNEILQKFKEHMTSEAEKYGLSFEDYDAMNCSHFVMKQK